MFWKRTEEDTAAEREAVKKRRFGKLLWLKLGVMGGIAGSAVYFWRRRKPPTATM
ncbi:MAG: hypothetical protein IBX61_07430 [Thermoleophilia bacterium]|nr:hypothetical protein [Thermoleophilia bacterium]